MYDDGDMRDEFEMQQVEEVINIISDCLTRMPKRVVEAALMCSLVTMTILSKEEILDSIDSLFNAVKEVEGE